MNKLLHLLIALTITIGLTVRADQYSNVSINGQLLTSEQLTQLQWQLGAGVPAGHYLVDANGCWYNQTTGAGGCGAQGTVDTHSRYGSGEITSDGSWNHYSNAAGMGVGGTSDGCIYTTSGWSNC